MKHYKEVFVEEVDIERKNLLIALFSGIGFDGFEEGENSLKAFINSDLFERKSVEELASKYHFRFSLRDIEEEDWNALWESNFDPVVVDDFVSVLADFHHQKFNTKYEIRITPKMSFGTGHHATTFMMMQWMQSLNFKDRSVFDFGTGTGVLAILAEKLDARNILAMDNDDWSVGNAVENLRKNNCKRIKIEKGHTPSAARFDIVLANINKNILLANATPLSACTGDVLLLSGLLSEDEPDMVRAFSPLGLILEKTVHRGQWISMLWRKAG